MKLLIFITLFVASCSSNKPNISNADLLKYKQAYNYIINDTVNHKQNLMVSDTIIFMESALFWEDLKTQNEKPETTINRLDSIDNKRKYDNFYSSELSKTFDKNTIAEFSLYFSKVIDDRLIAEVIDNKGLFQASYNRITMFNTGRCYLFIFDARGQLKSVIKKEINYN